jgi:tripartite ATP-independent transporter DctP family solute receptor
VHTCGINVLAEELEGWFDVQLFPDAQLGLAGQVMQLVQAGQFEAAMNGPGQLQAFWAPMGIFSAIYVIDDADHFQRVWDSDIGDDLRAGLAEEANLAAPLVVWWGTRQMTSNEPIRSPEDLDGVNLRVSPGSEIAITNAEAMGAEPSGGIGFGELYLALQTGVVDAQENPLPAINDGAFYEVQDYLNLTGHEPSPQFMVVNNEWWEGLSEEHRQAFNEAAAVARESAFECTLAAEQELLDQWRAEGVWEGGIVDDVDVAAFREAAEPVLLDAYGDVWSELDLYNRIRAMSSESAEGAESTETTES